MFNFSSNFNWPNFREAYSTLGDGIDSFPLGPSIPGNTWGMTRHGNYLYVAGSFKHVGEISSRYLARWNGSTWDTIPGGQPNNVVDDILVYNNELYICGTFDSVGSVAAKGIARWDGTNWFAVGNYPFTPSGWILRMEFYHGNLYVGGIFDDPQLNTCRLAKWDGNTWQFMTNDLVGSIADVHDMKVYNDELYVSGLFYQTSGNVSNSIMRWNDTTWRDVGGGVEFYSHNVPQVRQMEVHNSKLYCAGNFEIIGGIFAFGIASWDGTNWCGYNSSFVVNSQECGTFNLAFMVDTLYVSGGFNLVDGVPINSIAKWIGGSFVDTCGNTTEIEEALSNSVVSIYPNPARDQLLIQFSSTSQKSILLYDSFGRLILTEQASSTQHTINVESFAEGIYFYNIVEEGEVKASGKIIVQH